MFKGKMPKKNLSVVEPSLALFFDHVLGSIGEECLELKIHHLASSVELDVRDCLAPLLKSPVSYPKGVAD